ncbi:MAG: methyltransferase family protein [Candidatus Limnocylindrales bacterium]
MSRLPTLGARGEGWVAIQVVLLLAVVAAGVWFGPDWSGPLRFVGILAGLAAIGGGVILVVRGSLDLGGALTPLPHPRDDAQLVEMGVYGLARHPIYGGLILAALGWSWVQASVPALVGAVVLAAFFVLKSAREEVWLIQRFAGYAAYRERTRRFIPWIC